MSGVKEFYLVKFSKCPKCGAAGALEHLKGSPVGARFDCTKCGQRMDFPDYIKLAMNNIDKSPMMALFEKCYYEVNKV